MDVLIFTFTMGFVFGMILTGILITMNDKKKERLNITNG